MFKILFSLAVIAAGLSFGYILQLLLDRGRPGLPWDIPTIRRFLQKLALWFFMAVSLLAAIWSLKGPDPRLAVLPFIGALVILSSGAMGWLLGRLLGLPDQGRGALFSVSAMSNIGSIGALVAFVFLGEAGFALVPLYKLFEEIIYYSICFPLARQFGPQARQGDRPLARLKTTLTDPFVLVALAAICLGGLLNLLGLPRPAFMSTVSSIFVPTGTFLLLTSIGLAMSFTRMGGYLKAWLSVVGVKFLFAPALALSLGWLAGLGGLGGGLPLKVLLVVSCMPVGFIAMIPPSIYDLDVDLANTCWLATTAGMVVVLPVLHLILPLL